MIEVLLDKLPEIISAVGAAVALWFTYNQYTKNKITDYKLEKWKNEEANKNIRQAGNIATIYGELWELLHFLKADRVYIIQPHPLYKSLFMSATLEVKRTGVASVRDTVKNITLSSIAKFSSELANKDFFFIEDVEKEQNDKRVKSLMQLNGCYSMAFKRLTDENDNWIGNLVIDYTNEFSNVDIDQVEVEQLMSTSASIIQYILPEYKVPDEK